MRKRKTTKKKHQPVRVTHTHEVIRQVQQPNVNMATKQEEAEEQNFFAGKLKEQEQERKHTMAAAHENEKPRGKDAPGTVKSDVGETEAPTVFGGDGITPIAEWEESQKERRAKQAEHDEKRRKQAVEDAGVIITTAKGK